MLAQTLFLALSLAVPAAPVKVVYFPPELYLVRVKTVGVKGELGRIFTGTFRVTEVYAGPADLVGKEFSCRTPGIQVPTRLEFSNTREVHEIDSGAEGLWWVRPDPKDKTKLVPELLLDRLDDYQLRRFPYQKTSRDDRGVSVEFRNLAKGKRYDAEAEFKEGLAWAEAVATVYKAKTQGQRKTILEGLAVKENSPVAGWALCVLGRADPAAHLDFLKKQAENEKLAMVGQVALDRLLCDIDPEGWKASEARVKMAGRWLDPKGEKASFEMGCRRLLDATFDADIDFDTYAKVLDPVLAKADGLDEYREAILGRLLAYPTFWKKERGKAFDWFLGHARKAKTESLRFDALCGLGETGPWNETQVEALREFQKTTPDRKLKEGAAELLKSPKRATREPKPRKEATKPPRQ